MTARALQELLSRYVSPDCAKRMAAAIFEDMTSINFEVVESCFTSSENWRRLGVKPQAEYELPQNQFDINSENGAEALEGSFLTTGNLLRLAQCVLLGRQFLPELWPGKFAARLNGQEHLDALNEIWWLKHWRDIRQVSRGPKKSENDPDFEWEIKILDGLADCVINLEVKRRTSNINKFFKRGRPTASIRKVAKKFRAVERGVANVAAITIYHPVSREIDDNLRSWLEGQEYVHGLLLWTEGNFNTPPLKRYFKDSHRWVEFLLNEPEKEDLSIAGRAIGTLCESDDVSEFLTKISNRMLS